MLVRNVSPEDIKEVLELIKGLAIYENEPEAVTNTAAKLHDDLFMHKYCEALVAEKDNVIIGFALYYTSYSTWKGPCIYLEDLYIIPEQRNAGVGGRLFDAVVAKARERKATRMDWQVLDWNESAIQFYKKKKATFEGEWLNGRLFFPEYE